MNILRKVKCFFIPNIDPDNISGKFFHMRQNIPEKGASLRQNTMQYVVPILSQKISCSQIFKSFEAIDCLSMMLYH